MPSVPVAVSGLKPGALGLKEFTFSKRTLKLNWRELSQLKMNKIIDEVDIDALQENLEMITFCNAAGADVQQYADPNFVKVFQLAQLMLEYNLYTTEIIDEARLNTEAALAKEKAAHATAKATVTKQKDEVAMLKKELKLQRKTIAVYEDRLSKVLASETYFKDASNACSCQVCGKVFSTAAHLTSHMIRRHSPDLPAGGGGGGAAAGCGANPG
eukprot:SAG22_NODE_6470_length_850_cov_1.234354_1_plen_213_part_01